MSIDLNAVLVDATMKGTVVLCAGLLLNLALSNAAAATRRFVCLLTLVSTLAMPLLCAALPGWNVLPAHAAERIAATQSLNNVEKTAIQPPALSVPMEAAQTELKSISAPATRSQAATARAAPVSKSDVQPRLAFHFLPVLLWAWFAGALLLFLRILMSWATLRQLAARASPAQGAELKRALAEASAKLQVRRSVRFRLSTDCPMPMTWGVLFPTILLPHEAEMWPKPRLRPVLLHELAHIKCRDALALMLAQIACALYWFHPLIWLVARMMAREQERSSDDLVLAAQEPPANYARLLLELATGCPNPAATAAVAMARPLALERRLRAIIDPMQRRGRMPTARSVCGALVSFTMVAMLAALRTQAQTPALSTTRPVSSLISYRGRVLTTDGQPVAGAEVVLKSYYNQEIARTRSGADGGFTVAGPPSRYKDHFSSVAVRAATGFGSAWMLPDSDNVIQIRPLSLVKVIFLDSEEKPVAGLRVRPTFSSIRPLIRGAAVSPGYLSAFDHPNRWSDQPPIVTDESGACVLTLPRQSQTQIEIDHPEYAQPSNNQRVQTGAGAESQPVTLHLKQAGRISGKVTSSVSGKPVAGIHVIAIAQGNSGAVTHGAWEDDITTNDRGEYQIRQVEPGKYMMRLYLQEDIGWTAAFRKEVIVTAGNTTADQDFVLIKGSVVTGRLFEEDTGRGVADASIVAIEPQTRQYPSAIGETDAEGRFSQRVPPGPMQIYMATSPPEGYSADDFNGMGSRLVDFTAIDGQDIKLDLKLRLRPGKPLNGRVIDPDGKPMAGATVTGRDPRADLFLRNNSIVKADERGEFHFRAIQPGTLLSARLGAMGTLEPLTFNGNEQNLVITLSPNFQTTLTGRVVDGDGKPIENARISLGVGNGRYMLGPGGTPDALTDANGRFTLQYLTPDSTYRLQIDANGYRDTPDLPYKPGQAVCDLGDIKMAR